MSIFPKTCFILMIVGGTALPVCALTELPYVPYGIICQSLLLAGFAGFVAWMLLRRQ